MGRQVAIRTIVLAGGMALVLCAAVALLAVALRHLRTLSQEPNARGGDEERTFTLLHRAAEKGLINSLNLQLERGEDADLRDDVGMTPLHYAARTGEPEAAEILLGHGAEADARGDRGWRPLHMAAAMGHVEVAELLLRHGADPNAADEAGLTPLHHAAGEGEREAAALLASAGAELDRADRLGWTPLHHAAHENHADVVALLTEEGADVGLRRPAQMTSSERSESSRQSGPLAPPARGGIKRLNVLLIIVDALRPDRLGCYGYQRETSPTLDAVAAQGALFTDAMAQGAETTTSMPSVLAGRRPGEPGMEWVSHRDKVFARPAGDCPTLAELLKRGGYATAGITANPLIGPTMGVARGFDYFDDSCGRDRAWLRTTAPAVNERACEWLEEREPDDGPFFLYLHYLEPHNQYRPPSEFCLFGRPGYTPRDDARNEEMNRLPETQPDQRVTEEALREAGLSLPDVERLSDLYDGEVRCVDHYVGRLLERLRQLGLYENTLIIVTADHGEAFLEHEFLEHGGSLHQEQIRVPLIVRTPGAPGGRRVEGVVELVDLAPTILQSAGIEAPAGMSGWSFYDALVRGGRAGDDAGLAEIPYRETKALRLGNQKLIVSPDGVELYDLEQDPGEESDLAAARPEEVRRLRDVLRGLTKDHTPPEAAPEAPSEHDLDALKSLGYL